MYVHVYMFVCLFVCLLVSTYQKFNLTHLNASQRLNIHMHFSSVESNGEGLLPEYSVSVKEAWSEDDSI